MIPCTGSSSAASSKHSSLQPVKENNLTAPIDDQGRNDAKAVKRKRSGELEISVLYYTILKYLQNH